MKRNKEIKDVLEYFQELGISELSVARISQGRQNHSTGPQAEKDPSTLKVKREISPEALPATSPKFSIPPQTPDLFAPLQASSKPETLEEVRADLGDCHRCKLAPLRKTIVFGSGSPNAALMFIGEAPGADEDEQGLPFVGRAGQLLTKIIEAISLKREDVYICNVIKCRPPENRTPERDEIESCEPFLLRQIQSVKPKVIVCLGSPAMQTLLKIKTGITQIRGQWLDYNGIKLMATFHPAYCLRWPEKKREVWEDMKKVRDYLRFVGAI